MIMHTPRTRPVAWQARKHRLAPVWLQPLVALEWTCEWAAFALSNWAFLEVLEYLGTFSVLIAVIFYFSESGDRIKLRHYQAWQVINTAQGKGGSGGRIEALQELNADHVPLVGMDVSSAFLQNLHLENANLLRSDFSSADLRNSILENSSALNHASFAQADLRNADLTGASLVGADFSGAELDGTDLRSSDLKDVAWQHIRSIKAANVAAVRNPPAGFIAWALQNGAVDRAAADE
jgi:Pentapeptide repeats (8 copies)